MPGAMETDACARTQIRRSTGSVLHRLRPQQHYRQEAMASDQSLARLSPSSYENQDRPMNEDQ